jgi:hypothetical protein
VLTFAGMRERIDYTEPPISFEDRRENGVGDVDMQVGPEGHALVEREEVRSGHLRESWVELGTGGRLFQAIFTARLVCAAPAIPPQGANYPKKIELVYPAARSRAHLKG